MRRAVGVTGGTRKGKIGKGKSKGVRRGAMGHYGVLDTKFGKKNAADGFRRKNASDTHYKKKSRGKGGDGGEGNKKNPAGRETRRIEK